MSGAKALRACEVAADMSLYNDILAKGSGRECWDLATLMIFSFLMMCKKWTCARLSLGREAGRCYMACGFYVQGQ